MTVELNHSITISPEVLCQEVSGEMVLLDLKSEAYFGLDATGTRIWQLLQDNQDLQAAFDVMLAEYDVEEDQLRDDFEDLLTKLSGAGLISLNPSR
jgi:hypothetical protein